MPLLAVAVRYAYLGWSRNDNDDNIELTAVQLGYEPRSDEPTSLAAKKWSANAANRRTQWNGICQPLKDMLLRRIKLVGEDVGKGTREKMHISKADYKSITKHAWDEMQRLAPADDDIKKIIEAYDAKEWREHERCIQYISNNWNKPKYVKARKAAYRAAKEAEVAAA